MTAYGVAGGQRSELAFYDFREAAPGGRLQGFFVYRTGRRPSAKTWPPSRSWWPAWLDRTLQLHRRDVLGRLIHEHVRVAWQATDLWQRRV